MSDEADCLAPTKESWDMHTFIQNLITLNSNRPRHKPGSSFLFNALQENKKQPANTLQVLWCLCIKKPRFVLSFCTDQSKILHELKRKLTWGFGFNIESASLKLFFLFSFGVTVQLFHYFHGRVLEWLSNYYLSFLLFLLHLRKFEA